MKTLYLTDLDGTLLTQDERVSEYTRDVVGRVVRAGESFSFATARSVETARKACAGLAVSAPVIVHNGVALADFSGGKILWHAGFSAEEGEEILAAFEEAGLAPIVYSFLGGRCRFSYFRAGCSAAQLRFLAARSGDVREREVQTKEELHAGEIYYFTCIGARESLQPVYEKAVKNNSCLLMKDLYLGEYFLEVLPKGANKKSAAQRLKAMLGCDRLVCFGDSLNDLPMFEIADECYAVANAAPELKEKATAIIPSNREDGVAKWLEENCLKRGV